MTPWPWKSSSYYNYRFIPNLLSLTILFPLHLQRESSSLSLLWPAMDSEQCLRAGTTYWDFGTSQPFSNLAPVTSQPVPTPSQCLRTDVSLLLAVEATCAKWKQHKPRRLHNNLLFLLPNCNNKLPSTYPIPCLVRNSYHQLSKKYSVALLVTHSYKTQVHHGDFIHVWTARISTTVSRSCHDTTIGITGCMIIVPFTVPTAIVDHKTILLV